MMAMNVRSSVVMATNSGFSGESVTKALTDAMRTLSDNPSINNADDRALSSAINDAKPANGVSGNQDVNQMLPKNGRDSGRSM